MNKDLLLAMVNQSHLTPCGPNLFDLGERQADGYASSELSVLTRWPERQTSVMLLCAQRRRGHRKNAAAHVSMVARSRTLPRKPI
jgi:hypothetical protein